MKPIVALLAGLVIAGENASADGKIDLNDLGFLMPLIGLVPPAFLAAKDVDLKAIDEAKEKEIHDAIDEAFGAGKYQLIGEDLLQASLHLISAYNKLAALKSSEA